MSQSTPNPLNPAQQAALDAYYAEIQRASRASLQIQEINRTIAQVQERQLQQALAMQRQAFSGSLTNAMNISSGISPSSIAKPTPLMLEEAQLIAGPIVGYRGWDVTSDGWLISQIVNTTTIWVPGQPNHARCPIPQFHHSVPTSQCSCGLYAYRIRKTFRKTSRSIQGTVALWGTVIQHKEGYRAEYAYPLTLWKPTALPMAGFPASNFIDKIGERYGVPVIPEPQE